MNADKKDLAENRCSEFNLQIAICITTRREKMDEVERVMSEKQRV